MTKFCWVKGPVFLESASPATGNTTEVSTESAGALSGVKTASASPVAEPRLKVELPGVTAAKGPGSEIGAIRSVMLGAGGASSSDYTKKGLFVRMRCIIIILFLLHSRIKKETQKLKQTFKNFHHTTKIITVSAGPA